MGTPCMNHIRWMTPRAAILLLTGFFLPFSLTAQVPARGRIPRFATVDSANPSNAALQAYISSLRFVTDHVSADVRVMDPAHPNQIARVEPAEGVNLLTLGEFRSAGRITARIENLRGEPINRFALEPKGKTYLWIQYVHEQLKGVLISTDSTGTIVARKPVRVRPVGTDHPRFVRQPLARFGTDTTTYSMMLSVCGFCPQTGWCYGDSTGTATWY